jgi:hypothetical protein
MVFTSLGIGADSIGSLLKKVSWQNRNVIPAHAGIQYALDSINAVILDTGPGFNHSGASFCAGVTKPFSTNS